MSRRLKEIFPISLRDFIITLTVLGCSAAICAVLQKITTSDVHVPMIFVLAVLIISLLTKGYLFGTLAAVVSVFGVNWAFTYPYRKLDFSIYGYPLTFITMLAVCIVISTLTSRIKEVEKLRIETEKEKTRANLLRSVSHDLRTPLTAISGSITAILDDDGSMSSETERELLENAKQDAEWLYRMVENLLSITRINGNSAGDINKSDELLEEVISEAVSKFKKRNGNIDVKINIPDEIMFVPMDAMLVEQLIINLVDNAVIHGGKTDTIEIKSWDSDHFVYISIIDNGNGIDIKDEKLLFSGNLENGSGTDANRFMGIGLAVCKTIAEAHGGSISASNMPDGGAKFTFSLLKGEKNEY